MYFRREDDYDKMKQAVTNIDLKFANKEVVTPKMKELIILPFMQSLSLNADIAFEVLDQYLSIEYKKYLLFKSLEKKFEDIENQLKNQFNIVQHQRFLLNNQP